MKMLNNIIDSYKHIPSTFAHKGAMLKLEKQFKGRISMRIIFHDMDKILMYAFVPFLGTTKIKQIHRSRKHHQYYSDNLSEKVIQEMVIDWESAQYTKPNKPQTARQYTMAKRMHIFDRIVIYLDKWGI